DLAARRRAVEAAQAREADWTAAWGETCSRCWLGETGTAPGVGTVREMLATLDQLVPAIERKASLTDRIGKMTKDQEAFREHVAALADLMRIEARHQDPVDLARRIAERIREAVAERDQRAKAVEAIEAATTRKAALDATLAIHAGRKEAMTAHFGVATLEAVAARLADVARRSELRTQAEAAEYDILDGLRLDAIGQAEKVLDDADRQALDAEFSELKARFGDQDRLCQELFAQRSDAIGKVEAIGGDDTVAEIEGKRRTTLLEIEDGALRYLQLRAGTAATEHGLRVYRERHRSAMMARASEAFRTISRGAYTGLAAQPGKDAETLIALAAGGGSKQASELSKGTRFQLYLALRVAGYDEFVRTRAPLPFIADDIMETFDDFRAEEAFRLLAEMAGIGQVVYLTHHRHLCDVARTISPSVRIHELSGALPAA
ncbi:ATP-binding protein, partial [Methylobacterium haplocladii]